HSIRSRNAGASTSPSRNGVTRAVRAPLIIVGSLPPYSTHSDHLVRAQLDLATKNLDGVAGHEDVIRVGSAGAPFDFKIAAAQLYRRGPLGVVRQNRRDQRRACSGAAGPSFTRAAFPHAHPEMAARDCPDELGIYAAGKERMMLKLAAQLCEITILQLEDAVIGNEHDAMRIAHRDRRDRLAHACDIQWIVYDSADGVDRDVATFENRLAHIDRRADDAAAFQPQLDRLEPGVGLHNHRICAHKAALKGEPRKASDAVATHVAAASVRVVHLHSYIGVA